MSDIKRFFRDHQSAIEAILCKANPVPSGESADVSAGPAAVTHVEPAQVSMGIINLDDFFVELNINTFRENLLAILIDQGIDSRHFNFLEVIRQGTVPENFKLLVAVLSYLKYLKDAPALISIEHITDYRVKGYLDNPLIVRDIILKLQAVLDIISHGIERDIADAAKVSAWLLQSQEVTANLESLKSKIGQSLEIDWMADVFYNDLFIKLLVIQQKLKLAQRSNNVNQIKELVELYSVVVNKAQSIPLSVHVRGMGLSLFYKLYGSEFFGMGIDSTQDLLGFIQDIGSDLNRLIKDKKDLLVDEEQEEDQYTKLTTDMTEQLVILDELLAAGAHHSSQVDANGNEGILEEQPCTPRTPCTPRGQIGLKKDIENLDGTPFSAITGLSSAPPTPGLVTWDDGASSTFSTPERGKSDWFTGESPVVPPLFGLGQGFTPAWDACSGFQEEQPVDARPSSSYHWDFQGIDSQDVRGYKR